MIVIIPAGAQQPDDALTKLHRLGLPEAQGSVPVSYVPSAKERAIRFQKSLEAAHLWYENQLHVHVPIALAVLDADTWGKIPGAPYPVPHSYLARGGPGLVVVHGGLPDSGQGPAIAGADHDHTAGGILQGEPQLFHEDGHILADLLKIRSGNSFVNELIANIFQTAYIGAERHDLNWFLEDRRTGRRTSPRYTSLADLDYLYSGVGTTNYFWFQWHLERLADFLAADQSFPSVIERLQKAFPADEVKQETLEEIDSHLERIRPGFVKMAGPLAGPATITRITPSACPESAETGESRYPIVVRNDTTDPLVVNAPDGKAASVPAHAWRTYARASLKLPTGDCLVARDEPTLAVIEKH